MANTTLDSGDIGAHAKVLTAATAETVTFGDDCSAVEVIVLVAASNAAHHLYVTLDGSTPTSGGANCYIVPNIAGESRILRPHTGGATVVKLISAGTPTYSVQRVNPGQDVQP